MSQAAARAMRILADCMDAEANEMPAGQGYATMTAMARAHRRAADLIEADAAPKDEKGATPESAAPTD